MPQITQPGPNQGEGGNPGERTKIDRILDNVRVTHFLRLPLFYLLWKSPVMEISKDMALFTFTLTEGVLCVSNYHM
jgi:hypothetical protein